MAAQYMPNSGFELRVRQQPKYARVAVGKEKDRKPIDPPPIVQLVQQGRRDPNSNFLQSPYLILTARLVSPKDEDSSPDDQSPSPSLKENALSGTVVSSLYSLKDTDNTQGGFFVFGDLSVRKEGHYRLEFTLYELKLQDRECWMLCRILSDKFQVYSHKEFPGMAESTFLTRSFSDQGVRLRLRKDSRSITTRKRNHSVAQGVDQLRAAGAHMYGQVHSPEQSPTGHPHAQYRRSTSLHDGNLPGGALDRSRASMTPGGTGYFADSPQMRNDYAAGSYGYAGYEERSAKRHRVDSGIGSHGYEDNYSTYPQPAPRTVPEMGGSLYPMSTGYQMAPQPAMSGLPVPSNQSPYTSMPRLNTQMAPQHGTPNSAGASPFSPNAQRSPGTSYQYPPSGAMYSSSMPYQQGGTPPLPQPNGLGLVGMPSLDPEVEKQSTVTPGI